MPQPPPTSARFRCNECPTTELWDSERAAQAAAVWHVFLNHVPTWESLAGARMPQDPMPELIGTRVIEPQNLRGPF